MEKIDRSYIRKIRSAVQWAVFLMVVYAGATFYFFTKALELGLPPTFMRPPSVEGFLPIGGFMSLKLWVTEGLLDPIHPAAPIIFASALLLSLLLRKSFCGWICPVGTLSEAVWMLGGKVCGRNFRVQRYADYALRSLKYIIMGLFLYVVLIKMSSSQIVGFMSTPYWKVADVKMLKFFTDMSTATAVTLGILVVLSFVYKNFWCRYLCPYGGLLGLLGSLSPVGIKRDKDACINCGLCAKHCPSHLPVDERDSVNSPECTGCLTCVSRCPAKRALDARAGNKQVVRPGIMAVFIVAIFFGIIAAAHLSGRWHSSVSYEELKALLPVLKSLEHP